jgi:hypothetical protein
MTEYLEGQPSMESSSQSTDGDKYRAKKIASPPRKSKQPSSLRRKSKQPPSSISTIVDTVTGMQKAASETYNTIQEWAQSPKDVARAVTPCGTGASRRNEPKASIKLFSYAEMLPERRPEVGESNTEKVIRALREFAEDAEENNSIYTEETNAYKSIYTEETRATADTSPDFSILRRLTACTGGGLSNLSVVKEEMNQAVGGVRDAWACVQREDDDQYPDEGASIATVDSEAVRLRRLTSWGTIGTVDTSYSEATFGTLQNYMDDDGRPIDPKLVEKMMSEKRQKKKKPSVKFEYPPISSVRECPRHHVEDLPILFFTEEELDQIEDDRECTEIADDVEVVAVSSSLTIADSPASPSSSVEPRVEEAPSSDSSSPAKGTNKFSAHLPTPRMWSKRKGGGTYFSFSQSEEAKSLCSPKSALLSPKDTSRGRAAQREDSSKPRRRACTPRRGAEPEIVEEEKVAEGIAETPMEKDDPRLIKSVQIYLRERSTFKSPTK